MYFSAHVLPPPIMPLVRGQITFTYLICKFFAWYSVNTGVVLSTMSIIYEPFPVIFMFEENFLLMLAFLVQSVLGKNLKEV